MEKKKKVINIFTAFFISYKSNVKTFLKWILNQCCTALINMTFFLIVHKLFLNYWSYSSLTHTEPSMRGKA